ncbi:MAG: patatin-like phospholipase family protein [Clostridia bacterium]|jgi:predicted esterase of the alpha-beta hydrolase superfamily|nr:patatin-like phospholipase family protein [Clostridium sp.]CDE55498.1 patatin [Clostridium sp. CAG:269]
MKVGVSLAGGGIRGIAHVGVLKALEEKNIKVAAIAGTSAGSIIATLYAMGYSPYYIYLLFKRYARDIINIRSKPIINGITNFIRNNKIGIAGLSDGNEFEKMYDELARKKGFRLIGDIKMPLLVSAVDIGESKEYIFTNCASRKNIKDNYITEIGIGRAVRASSSFPAIFCPCEYKNHIFMDGGVLNNLPTEELKKVYTGKIISVNFESDPVYNDYDIMNIIMKTLDIMGNKLSINSLKKSDFVLTVPTDGTGLIDVDKMDICYKYGYEIAIKNIDKIRKMLE